MSFDLVVWATDPRATPDDVRAANERCQRGEHPHRPADPRVVAFYDALTGDYPEEPGVVQGVVTMYTAYAPYLQMKEIAGGVWGQPSPGNPVTIEVLEVYWEPIYIPMLERIITQRMSRYANS